MLLCQFETAAIAALEQVVFVVAAAMPYRTDSVKDPFGGQVKARCGLGVSGSAAAQFAAFCQQFRPCRTVNGAVDSAATQERGIGRVHDCIHSLGRDVTLHGNQFGHISQPHDSSVLTIHQGNWMAVPPEFESCSTRPESRPRRKLWEFRPLLFDRSLMQDDSGADTTGAEYFRSGPW